MDKQAIKGFTRELGKPSDWDDNKYGTCGALPIRDESHRGGIPRMVSAWKPTEYELKLLNDGGVVELAVIGFTHPPVSLTVVKE